MASLNMTLDEMVKKSRSERSARGRGGKSRRAGGAPARGAPARGGGSFNGGRGNGAVRRGPLAVNARPSSFTITKPSRRTRSLPWQHDLFEDSLRAAGITGVEVGTKLFITNLDHGVTNEDIRELFSEIGELKRYAVHFDKTGRPSGSSEVVYLRRSDAFAALKRYNNVLLDGKPMKIEVVGANPNVPVLVSARVNVSGVNGRKKRTVVMMPGMGQGRVGPARIGPGRLGQGRVGQPRGTGPISRGTGPSRRGGMRNGRGRGRGLGGGGRGRGKKNPVEKSADELDKDLENYHAEAMNTS